MPQINEVDVEPNPWEQKKDRLKRLIAQAKRCIVAFSGGVDSTLVLKLAKDLVGTDQVLAVAGVSPSLPQRELQQLQELAKYLGAKLRLIETHEIDRIGYVANGPDRCYHCKTELYTRLLKLASEEGYDTLFNGVIADDNPQQRPGVQAAQDLGVRRPLLEAGFTKDDVRTLAEELGLPNAFKPALACLASRIPFGTPVTIESLSRIEQAEAFLWERGFSNFRVRHHGDLARIEADLSDLPRLIESNLRRELIAHFKKIGYTQITLDLQGFRSGSSHETSPPKNTHVQPSGRMG